MNSYDLVDLQVSFPVVCAAVLDRLEPAEMMQRFGPDYRTRHDAEVRAMSEYYGLPIVALFEREAA